MALVNHFEPEPVWDGDRLTSEGICWRRYGPYEEPFPLYYLDGEFRDHLLHHVEMAGAELRVRKDDHEFSAMTIVEIHHGGRVVQEIEERRLAICLAVGKFFNLTWDSDK